MGWRHTWGGCKDRRGGQCTGWRIGGGERGRHQWGGCMRRCGRLPGGGRHGHYDRNTDQNGARTLGANRIVIFKSTLKEAYDLGNDRLVIAIDSYNQAVAVRGTGDKPSRVRKCRVKAKFLFV